MSSFVTIRSWWFLAVGINAAKMAAGLGAHVTILDISLDRLRYLDDVLPANVDTAYSNRHNILEQIRTADLVVGGVLIPGAKAPKLIRREDLKLMKQGAVIVDVAIDQGGCVETARPTTHSEPTYIVNGVVHYCVTNMPAIVPNTSTYALTNSTLSYGLQLANRGFPQAPARDKALADTMAAPVIIAGLRIADASSPVLGDDVMRLASERAALPWETLITLEIPCSQADGAKVALLVADCTKP